jgi:D-Tyr-tRNAtyr deacylase
MMTQSIYWIDPQSVKDLGLGVLCVSQFTLWGIVNGYKPDFHQAMNGKLYVMLAINKWQVVFL